MNLENRKVIVIGGGSVAARKTKGLIEAGAQVIVISPEVCDSIGQLAKTGQVLLLNRPYQPGDIAGAFLVIAATDNPETNQAVWDEAVQVNCLVNVVDDPLHSTFILPAVVRRGDMTISISTGGASPALARRLREKTEEMIGPEYAEMAQILGELRPELHMRFSGEEERLGIALRLIDSDLLRVIRQEGSAAGRRYARGLLTETTGLNAEDRP
jgi:precorrin-2 dehydrogenase/sirohydrochlorin ferrochelatase